jgi:hypothetical protein
MKIRRDGLRNVLLGSLLLVGAGAGVETASAQGVVSAGIHVGSSGRASVDLGFFYDDLAPYGNWIERPSHGWVWTPRAVASSWRPYQNGHWAATDEGWVWITDEPYGWATYHYGRWYEDPELGWSWVPGDTWGPSWVSFQEGNDYVGWAPLPPGVNVSVGFSGGGYAYGIAPAAYLFVPERNFLSPRLGGYYLGRDRVDLVYGQTRNCTNYRFQGGRVFNQGVPIDRIQRFGRVPRYQVADVGANFRQRGGRLEGNRLAMFRPQIQRTARLVPPNQRPAARRAVVSAAQFRAAHGDRVAFAQRTGQQNRLAAQAPGRQQQRLAQQQQRQQRTVVQREARTAQGERQRVAQVQRQTRNNTRTTRNNNNLAQRQAQANRQQQRQAQVSQQRGAQQRRQQVQANRQQQQRQAQMGRQQQRRQLQVNHRQQQQRQVQVSQQRGAQQRQSQMGRQQQQRQAQMGRQQQRQNPPPQQANPNRGGGPGRQQGRNNNRQHPGPGGQ